MSGTRSARRGNSLRSVEVLGWLLPVFGTEGEDVASGVIADAHEHVAQVVEGVDAVQLAGGDERVEDAGALRTFVAAGEEPILTAHGNPAQLPLRGVVIELESRVVEKACERPPLVSGVAESLGDGSLGQDDERLGIQPRLEGLEQGCCEPPTLLGPADGRSSARPTVGLVKLLDEAQADERTLAIGQLRFEEASSCVRLILRTG